MQAPKTQRQQAESTMYRISVQVSRSVAIHNLRTLPRSSDALVTVGPSGKATVRPMSVREVLELMLSVPEGETTYSESHRAGSRASLHNLQVRTEIFPGVPYHLRVRVLVDNSEHAYA